MLMMEDRKMERVEQILLRDEKLSNFDSPEGSPSQALSTYKNMTIVFFFELFMSAAYYVALSIGKLVSLAYHSIFFDRLIIVKAC